MPSETLSWMQYIVEPKRNEEMPTAVQRPTVDSLPASLGLSHDSYNRIVVLGRDHAVTSPIQFANEKIGNEFLERIDGYGHLQNSLCMALFLLRKALGGRKPAKGWTKTDDSYLESCLRNLQASKGNPIHGGYVSMTSTHVGQADRFVEAMNEIIAKAKAESSPQDAEAISENE